jgi:hypothetical protein
MPPYAFPGGKYLLKKGFPPGRQGRKELIFVFSKSFALS